MNIIIVLKNAVSCVPLRFIDVESEPIFVHGSEGPLQVQGCSRSIGRRCPYKRKDGTATPHLPRELTGERRRFGYRALRKMARR